LWRVDEDAKIVEVTVRASFETKGLPDADVDIKIGNVGASIDFRVKAWQAEKFVEVLNERIKELEKLIGELARQKELDEILNGDEIKTKNVR